MKKVVVSILILILFIGYYYISKYTGFTIPCIFHELTGFYCPGCGITRMFLSLFQFRFYQAFRYNPFVFVCLVGYLFYKIIPYEIPKKYKSFFINSLLILTILFGILRNIPLFSFLKPTLIS